MINNRLSLKSPGGCFGSLGDFIFSGNYYLSSEIFSSGTFSLCDIMNEGKYNEKTIGMLRKKRIILTTSASQSIGRLGNLGIFRPISTNKSFFSEGDFFITVDYWSEQKQGSVRTRLLPRREEIREGTSNFRPGSKIQRLMESKEKLAFGKSKDK